MSVSVERRDTSRRCDRIHAAQEQNHHQQQDALETPNTSNFHVNAELIDYIYMLVQRKCQPAIISSFSFLCRCLLSLVDRLSLRKRIVFGVPNKSVKLSFFHLIFFAHFKMIFFEI
jgi:hypothetical protein